MTGQGKMAEIRPTFFLAENQNFVVAPWMAFVLGGLTAGTGTVISRVAMSVMPVSIVFVGSPSGDGRTCGIILVLLSRLFDFAFQVKTLGLTLIRLYEAIPFRVISC